MSATPGPAQREEQALRKSAEQFEALLVHTMLKGMRKTTLSESNSNERAVYDDMFDDRVATIVSESGQLGIADAIVRQLGPQTTPSEAVNADTSPTAQLRAIMDRDRLQTRTAGSNETSTRTPIESLSALNVSGIRLHDHRIPPNAPTDALTGSPTGSSTGSPTGVSEARWTRFLHPLMGPAHASAQRLGTSPQAVLAIAALETGWGKHSIRDDSGNPSNNLFGIKAQAGDQRAATATTTEYIDGRALTVRDRFKVYDDPAASVHGFADFILDNPRYRTALQYASDPERFLVELQRAGYATDPHYAQKAISVMRRIQTHTGASG